MAYALTSMRRLFPSMKGPPPPAGSAHRAALYAEIRDQLIHLDSGRATDADREAVQAWRGRSAEHEAVYREAAALWETLREVPSEVFPELDEHPSAGRNVEQPAGYPGWVAAAAVVLVLCVGVLWYATGGRTVAGWFADYRAAVGQQQLVHLADRSMMHLNTDTAVNVVLSDAERRVDLLYGEAFFTVAPDAARPFVVSAHGVSVRALGTAFNVRVGADDASILVTHHAVEVTAGSPGAPQAVVVHEGEQVAGSRAKGLGPVEQSSPDIAIAWRGGNLVFRSQPLGTVIDQLNRYRRGKIMMLDRTLQNLEVTGVFSVSDPDGALDIIQRTLRVNVVRATPLLTLVY